MHVLTLCVDRVCLDWGLKSNNTLFNCTTSERFTLSTTMQATILYALEDVWLLLPYYAIQADY